MERGSGANRTLGHDRFLGYAGNFLEAGRIFLGYPSNFLEARGIFLGCPSDFLEAH